MLDRYAVLGNPVEHSLSPQIHLLFAKRTHQELTYEKILVEKGKLKKALKELQKEGFKGLNITLPFKYEVFEYCDELSERALAAGAVNTILYKADGKIYGDNTDGIGLLHDIGNNLGFSLKNKKVLLIGAGGAARGVIEPILNSKPQELIITNRTLANAQELVDVFKGKIKAIAFDELNAQFDCIINATSMGLENVEFPLSGNLIKPTSLCYDMVYGRETAFIKWAKKNNAGLIADGMGMLVEQAAESFYLWRGVCPDSKQVLSQFGRMKLIKYKNYSNDAFNQN